MANIDTYNERMQNIANAIRGKTGKTDKLTIYSMPTEIESIPGGGGNYNSSIDISGYSSTYELNGCLTYIDTSDWDTRTFSYLDGMFGYCSKLTSLDLSSFNTQKVTSMTGVFKFCKSLTSLDLSNFDTQNVTNMGSMFLYCSSLTSLNLRSFNTQNVTNMDSMFSNCSSLTSLDLSNFDTQNVTNMDSMFIGCSSLTSLDLSTFNTSNVTDMGNYSWIRMFGYCSKLTTLTLGDNWASNTKITSFYLADCPLTHDSCLDVFNKLATRTNGPTLKLESSTKALMTEDEIKIATDKGWTVS